MTGKIGLQEIEGCDPVFIVKLPKQYRLAPPGVIVGPYLRSTWFLINMANGKRPSGNQPINEWVERALFQFHPVADAVPAPHTGLDGTLILSLAPLSQCCHHEN